MIDVCASVNDNSSFSRYNLGNFNSFISDGSVFVAVLQSDARFRCNISEPVDRKRRDGRYQPNMAATQAESQRSEANVEQSPAEQLSESRNVLLQNGTDKSIGRVPPDGVVNTKSKSPMSADSGPPRDTGDAPGHDRPVDRPVTDQYGQYRYPEGGDYYSPRAGFPGKPRPPPQQPRFFPGQVSQAPGPTPTLNSLLQSSGAPPHRYPNSYEQPPAGYGPAPVWPPPRPMSPYNPQGGPYRNSTVSI